MGDVTGAVAGFADATGRFLPLVATLNAARVLDAAARMLGVDHDALSELALSAPAGAGGLALVPYLEGERTPNKPDATGAIHGLRLETANPAYLARAAVEGMLCGLADAVDAVRALGAPVERMIMVGGAARSRAVREIASAVLGLPVTVRRRGSTSPAVPRARPRGCSPVVPSRRCGRCPTWSPRRSSRRRPCASATPRCGS